MSARDLRGTNSQIGAMNAATIVALARADAAFALATAAIASTNPLTLMIGGYTFFVDDDGGLKIKTPDNKVYALVVNP